MTDRELCTLTLFESLAALIETNNADRALTILRNAIARNAIQRIDPNMQPKADNGKQQAREDE